MRLYHIHLSKGRFLVLETTLKFKYNVVPSSRYTYICVAHVLVLHSNYNVRAGQGDMCPYGRCVPHGLEWHGRFIPH